MESSLVTVATFSYAPEMGLVRSKLESEGIQCYVKDELVSQTYIQNAVGGMKLQVKEEDAERALEIIEKMGVFEQRRGRGKMMVNFERFSRRIPLLGGASLVVRLFALLILIAVILTVFYLVLVF